MSTRFQTMLSLARRASPFVCGVALPKRECVFMKPCILHLDPTKFSPKVWILLLLQPCVALYLAAPSDSSHAISRQKRSRSLTVPEWISC